MIERDLEYILYINLHLKEKKTLVNNLRFIQVESFFHIPAILELAKWLFNEASHWLQRLLDAINL